MKANEVNCGSDFISVKPKLAINALCTDSSQNSIFNSFRNQSSEPTERSEPIQNSTAQSTTTENSQTLDDSHPSIKRKNSFTLYMGTKSSETRKNETISSKTVTDDHSIHPHATSSNTHIANHQHIPLKPTVPISPKFRSASRIKERGGEKQLSSEELELLKIEKEKQEHKERLEKIKKLFEKNKIKTGTFIVSYTLYC